MKENQTLKTDLDFLLGYCRVLAEKICKLENGNSCAHSYKEDLAEAAWSETEYIETRHWPARRMGMVTPQDPKLPA